VTSFEISVNADISSNRHWSQFLYWNFNQWQRKDITARRNNTARCNILNTNIIARCIILNTILQRAGIVFHRSFKISWIQRAVLVFNRHLKISWIEFKISWIEFKISWNDLEISWIHFKISWNEFKISLNEFKISWNARISRYLELNLRYL